MRIKGITRIVNNYVEQTGNKPLVAWRKIRALKDEGFVELEHISEILNLEAKFIEDLKKLKENLKENKPKILKTKDDFFKALDEKWEVKRTGSDGVEKIVSMTFLESGKNPTFAKARDWLKDVCKDQLEYTPRGITIHSILYCDNNYLE
ncbi:hypothetical protein R83H12_01206 [Fibrobacteria bacterium R8-3-H12]